MNNGMYGISQMINGITGNSGQVWLNVAFVVCAFFALIIRPEGICSRVRFRCGCGVFAISLLIPGFTWLLAGNMEGESVAADLFFYSSVLSSLLYPLAFFLAVTSMVLPGGATPAKGD
jgi:hypothetical protein